MSKIKKYNLSLIETLLAIFFLGIFFNMVTMVYFEGRKSSRFYMDRAAHVKSVSTLSEYFRNYIHSQKQSFELEPNKIEFGNNNQVNIKNNKISFDAPGGAKVFAIPKAYVASFAQEKDDVLILYLWRKGNKKRVLKDQYFRIVAIPGEVKK